MSRYALRVIQSKTTKDGIVELCEYSTSPFKTNAKYGVEVNDKPVDTGFMEATTDDLQKAKRVYDSYK